MTHHGAAPWQIRPGAGSPDRPANRLPRVFGLAPSGPVSSFADMTRPLAVLLVATAVSLPSTTRSAEIDAEDFARLRGQVGAHDESIESFRRQLQRTEAEVVRLSREIDALRQTLANQRDLATQAQIKALADQVQELEKRRVTDNKEVLAALDRLARTPSAPPPAPVASEPVRPVNTGPELPAEYHEHTIETGQTLSSVITEYNRQLGYKVTLAHVLKANPEIKDPRRIRVGQKIRIPQVK